LTKRLNHLEKDLYLLVGETDLITGDSDICLLHQYEERMSDMKSELATILQQILALEDGDGALIEKQSELRKLRVSRSKSRYLADPRVDTWPIQGSCVQLLR
jgi:hypothetical protein